MAIYYRSYPNFIPNYPPHYMGLINKLNDLLPVKQQLIWPWEEDNGDGTKFINSALRSLSYEKQNELISQDSDTIFFLENPTEQQNQLHKMVWEI